MTDIAKLGGGYADSTPDAKPTAEALLAAARPGASSARLVIIGGPPGVGKTAVARALLSLLPNTFLIDKDQTAGGFILTAAAQRGDPPASAYGTSHYWQQLRPLEYAGPLTTACSNLVGTRQILLVGGFGPELGENDLWPSLGKKIAPQRMGGNTRLTRLIYFDCCDHVVRYFYDLKSVGHCFLIFR